MAYSSKPLPALPERPKTPSTEDMLEDLKTADDGDTAFSALHNIVNDACGTKGSGEATSSQVKLNENLGERQILLLTDNLNENSEVSREFEKVKRYLDANTYLETSQETIQADLTKLIEAKDEMQDIMKKLQEQLGQR
ncbi:uncharacterized protein LOC117119819 isoform X1 [Anneissia japonica]|uniref:uncharacterized protein LOC117119819 isoform X1 n=1 Tax=Anneissia japonica TaxID=1529436 RepID=UPI0014254C2A|nr:uncharacterized protein LOC117119819 isoform X1 [Anneissia japonica]XP_033120645.1 uncharacterized protein LOC117119819 isoform X1 [Anneissia japonica]